MKSKLLILILSAMVLASSSINSNYAQHYQDTCNYYWELLESDCVIIPVKAIFSSNDSGATIQTLCLKPLIDIAKKAKGKGMYLSYTLYNVSRKYKSVNQYFNKVLYNYLLSKGLDENELFSMFNSPHELPPPIINGAFVEIKEGDVLENESYFSFSLRDNHE